MLTGQYTSMLGKLAASPLRLQYLLILAFVTITGLFVFRQNGQGTGVPSSSLEYTPRVPPHAGYAQIPQYKDATPIIAKLSMLYGKPNKLYQRALASHERHAAIHNYPMHILRNELAVGYWNKPSFIQSMLLQELAKEPGDRMEWLMWVDADSIVMNPSLPATIFLPPQDHEFDHINLLVTRDNNGLNSGIFLIRVCEWSLEFMSKSLAYPLFYPKDDLGASADQAAMGRVINETVEGAMGRNHTAWVPKHWINADVGECRQGDLLVHFPGLTDREWHMKYWLNRAEGVEQHEWNKTLDQTEYRSETDQYWSRVRQCQYQVKRWQTWLNTTQTDLGEEAVPEEMATAVDWLDEVCWWNSANELDVDAALNNVAEVQQSLNLPAPPPLK